jgi:GDPmannose 4,6-dehydratase
MSLDPISKSALIFGVDGQDGSYLGEFLLKKGYQVIGWLPENSEHNWENLLSIKDNIHLIEGNLNELAGLLGILKDSMADEIYNLASPSFAAGSWEDPVLVGDVSGMGVLRILEAIKRVSPKSRFFQASSSEVFGDPVETPQKESTPFRPRNPYGISKAFAHQATAAYRNHYGLFAVSGILYNHESPRRPKRFVTRKVTDGAARISYGLQSELHLGDLDARRDWSFAGDVVCAMWMVLQSVSPKDYIIGSGETHSVREVCEIAFNYVGLDYSDFVISDERFIRPRETLQLCADPSVINNEIGWKNEMSFKQMIELMVEADLQKLHT